MIHLSICGSQLCTAWPKLEEKKTDSLKKVTLKPPVLESTGASLFTIEDGVESPSPGLLRGWPIEESHSIFNRRGGSGWWWG